MDVSEVEFPSEHLARIRALEAQNAALVRERDGLLRLYERLREELELMKRRLFVAKAERVDTKQLEITFAETRVQLEQLTQILGLSDVEPEAAAPPRKRRASSGRRNVMELELPETRVVITDPEFEKFATRIGYEESAKLAYLKGGLVRLVVATTKYKFTTAEGDEGFAAAERPRELVYRALAAPSLIAHVLMQKYGMGLPFYRLEERFACDGVPLDRGTMCRYAEEVGAGLGTIVMAMAKEAMETAFCLKADATGVAIQPTPLADKSRQACKRGHFFVVLADKDHVFFEYQARHTSEAVCEMFRGYGGFVQADASAIFDTLYRGDAVPAGAKAPVEVGCLAHARRKFWEAAVCKHHVGLEGLFRLRMIFEYEAQWQKLAPDKRLQMRKVQLTPLLNAFFHWCRAEFEKEKAVRGLVASALGYAVRHEAAFRRVLEDGRLRLDNNPSERALRTIATGRKAWLFFGSDDHASAAANLFSLIASCKLHAIEPERYLAEVIRILPQWPLKRHLELSPKYWTATRARLSPDELALPLGRITVPEPAVTPE